MSWDASGSPLRFAAYLGFMVFRRSCFWPALSRRVSLHRACVCTTGSPSSLNSVIINRPSFREMWATHMCPVLIVNGSDGMAFSSARSHAAPFYFHSRTPRGLTRTINRRVKWLRLWPALARFWAPQITDNP